ncbi:MAG: cytochrome P450 [Caulobacteraceae bacterium]
MIEFNPYSPAFDANPFDVYKQLRDEAPCFWSDHARMWVLTRHEDISRALQDWETYSSATGNLMDELPGRAGATLGTTDPPRHDRLRALVQHAFVRRNLDWMEADIRTATAASIDAIGSARRFDFVNDFAAKITVKALFKLLGLPLEDEDLIREKAVLMVQSDPVTRGKGPEHLAAFEWMKDFAAGVIAERREAPTGDLISQFSLAEIDGDRLEEREVLLTTTTLIMAGVESLGGFLAMFGLNLADFDDARRRCAADPKLIGQAIDESLRFNTSAQRFKRRIMKETPLHGQVMKPGDFVCLAYGAGNRDERKFPDPDTYDLDRKPMGHLGFGGGVHACLGAPIAKFATQLIAEELLARMPDFKRVDENLDWAPSSTFRSPVSLIVERA